MKVTFHHPPTRSKNPFLDFEPTNQGHYPDIDATGVYIYGIRLIIDGKYQFVPLVVGEGNLRQRLFCDHYCGKILNPYYGFRFGMISCLGDNKEMWDFSSLIVNKKGLLDLYSQMKAYDVHNKKKHGEKFSYVSTLDKLIYFQDFRFYEKKLSLSISGECNLSVVNVVEKLKTIRSPKITDDIIKEVYRIISSIDNLKDHFYYVFASINDKSVLKKIEKATKEKLAKAHHIYTTARAGGNIEGFEIDFSEVYECFPNLMKNHL